MVRLTEKQKKVLGLRARGYRNKQIAKMLFISEVTIHQHLRACCRKLKAVNTAHAIALATNAGILTCLDADGFAICNEGAQTLPEQLARNENISQTIVLTPKEHEILTCVLQGQTNAEIADKYQITLRTVETYFARMYRRNNVSGRMKLALVAMGANPAP